MTATSHTTSESVKAEARKALRDLYEDRDCPHRAELIKTIEDAMLSIGIPADKVNALAEESLRNAGLSSDEEVTRG